MENVAEIAAWLATTAAKVATMNTGQNTASAQSDEAINTAGGTKD